MPTETKELETIIPFAEKLQELNEKTLTTPVQPGKWSIREIIGHLYYWDRYLLEAMIPHMHEGGVLPPFPNPSVYNRAAIASLEGRRATRIVEEFLAVRHSLVEHLAGMDPAASFRLSGTEEIYTPERMIKKFAMHDVHHQKQMEIYLREGVKRRSSAD
ncbi:DinB family protein [Alkalicoccus halolimnae]|uniref:DinB family protein n=1 Tax=Alkalicoccus halolimnae TaxID=1667239 RepID=A0A5C7FFR1_9BACI|nr:DinB family protein [Alkalicoccus halolimnae]TXF86147.1 DinB family protein [Alkalicoccus halolimnae]